jgi:hypothetical protein
MSKRKYTMPVHCRGSQFEAVNVVAESKWSAYGQCVLCSHKGSVTMTTGYSKRVHKHTVKNS